jgi:hypothetical protein
LARSRISVGPKVRIFGQRHGDIFSEGHRAQLFIEYAEALQHLLALLRRRGGEILLPYKISPRAGSFRPIIA